MVGINLSRPKSGRGSHTKRRRAFRPASNPLECLERRDVPAVYSLPAGSTAADLVSTIFGLDPYSGPNTIQLAAGSTFTFDTIDNYFFGPNYLPIIASDLTIQGNGSTFQATGAVQARFFVVSGGYVSGGPAAGTLTLQGLTLEGGVAQGGSSTFGGGGAGMGGAIFNMGTLNLSGVTLTDNQARGGASNGNNPEATLHSGYGGGGMGTDAIGDSGGGNMGPDYPNPHGILLGGAGGSGSRGGGGGGGFSAPGGAANGDTGGNGGGSSGLGGDGGAYTGATYGGQGGDGGGGAGSSAIGGVGGNAFGGGGNKTGGGGVGGGGGGQSGGGGFGGGGGASGITGLGVASTAGNGGFGGGGGGANTAGNAQAGFGGFGGGNGGNFNGGGGAGMGGAVFNLFGNVNVSNSTFTANTATGGGVGANSGDPNGATPGSGMGGAIFNLDGDVQIVQSTLSGDNAPQGGAEIYSLSYGANPDGQDDDVIVTLTNSILSGNGNVLTSNQQSGTASVVSSGVNLVTSYQSLNGATTTGRRFMTRSPNLGALKDNGGLVPTMALLRGSPAINTGSSAALLATGASTDTDARGDGFRRIINRRVDLGAYEYQPPTTATRMVVRRAPDNLRAFDLIVAVRAAGIGANTPTGSVDLMAGDQVIASEPLVAGRAHFRVAIGTFARLRARAWAVFQGQRVGDYALNGSSTATFLASTTPTRD